MTGEEIKAILLEIVADLQSLRTNQAVLAAYVSHPPTIAAAEDAKHLLEKQYSESYRELREKIEKLS